VATSWLSVAGLALLTTACRGGPATLATTAGPDSCSAGSPVEIVNRPDIGPSLLRLGCVIVDGFGPGRYDILRVLICLLGAALIMYAPRGSIS
jgi:hypothetical protein